MRLSVRSRIKTRDHGHQTSLMPENGGKHTENAFPSVSVHTLIGSIQEVYVSDAVPTSGE